MSRFYHTALGDVGVACILLWQSYDCTGQKSLPWQAALGQTLVIPTGDSMEQNMPRGRVSNKKIHGAAESLRKHRINLFRSLDPAMVVWASRAPRRPDRRPKGSRHKILELTQTLETSVAQSHLTGGFRPSVATRKRCPPKHGVKERDRTPPETPVFSSHALIFLEYIGLHSKSSFLKFCCILPK